MTSITYHYLPWMRSESKIPITDIYHLRSLYNTNIVQNALSVFNPVGFLTIPFAHNNTTMLLALRKDRFEQVNMTDTAGKGPPLYGYSKGQHIETNWTIVEDKELKKTDSINNRIAICMVIPEELDFEHPKIKKSELEIFCKTHHIAMAIFAHEYHIRLIDDNGENILGQLSGNTYHNPARYVSDEFTEKFSFDDTNYVNQMSLSKKTPDTDTTASPALHSTRTTTNITSPSSSFFSQRNILIFLGIVLALLAIVLLYIYFPWANLASLFA